MATNTYSLDVEYTGTSQRGAYATDSASLSITGDLTIEFWIKPESLPEFMPLINKSVGSTSRSYRIGIETDGDITFVISKDGTFSAGQYSTYTPNLNLSTGAWAHVAFAFDASAHTTYSYLNGSPFGSKDMGVNFTLIADCTSNLYIGESADISRFDGKLDEIRIWNTQRTDSEIANNYNKQLVGDESGLQAYYQFNNDLLDLTANNNDLTSLGASVFSTDVPFTGSSISSIMGLAKASVKTVNGLAVGSIKSINGLA